MQFITALFGGTENTLLNSAFALGIVLVAIVFGLWALKVLTKAGSNFGRGKAPRLTVVDVARVDAKRQVMIIRRDNVEHVIMTGGPQDLVIESGIAVAEAPPPPVATPRPTRPRPTSTETENEEIDVPITPDRPVSREAVDRLRDLARPSPLSARPGQSLRNTGLMRREVIPMSPERRGDNSTAGPADSVTSAPVSGTNGQLRLGSKGRFFRGVIRGDRT